METLKSSDLLPHLLKRSQILLLQYGAESCLPCHGIQRKLDHWHVLHPEGNCLYIPIETFGQLAAQEGIFTVPTVLVYIQGKLAMRESGYFSLDLLLSQIERYIGLMEQP